MKCNKCKGEMAKVGFFDSNLFTESDKGDRGLILKCKGCDHREFVDWKVLKEGQDESD